jgi:DNA polymerase
VGGDLETIGKVEARSALSWWLESGVDLAIQEEARDWLRPAQARPAAAASAPPVPSNISEPAAATLAELQQWLSDSVQLPLASASAKRILPHGPEDAAIMLLSDAPALEDFTAGRPIGGAAWELAVRMLAAIGIGPDDAYSASLSCFYNPGARMSDKERAECAEIALRHLRLAKPKRLLLMGDGPCVALLGKRLVQARGHVHKVEGIRTVATFHPRHLINRPLDKGLAWRDLLLLTEDET